jgi:hypothetical protein
MELERWIKTIKASRRYFYTDHILALCLRIHRGLQTSTAPRQIDAKDAPESEAQKNRKDHYAETLRWYPGWEPDES